MKSKPYHFAYHLIALSTFIGFTANAQKLPNVQSAGVYAPANVKIDGNPAEWGGQLQAYNKNVSLYYTMANNNDNLYLVVQATDKIIVDKILGGGITLTITAGKNKRSDPINVSSPVLPPASRVKITQILRDPEFMANKDLPGLNKDLTAEFKEFDLRGFPAIKETPLSVYNEYGIKMTGLLDINKAYTWELAIPMKYLDQLVGSSDDLNYSIRLNGAPPLTGVRVGNTANSVVAAVINQSSMIPASASMELTSPTDFWASYTLIKK